MARRVSLKKQGIKVVADEQLLNSTNAYSEVTKSPTEEFIKNLDERLLPIFESVATHVREYTQKELSKLAIEQENEVKELNRLMEQKESYLKTAYADRDRYSSRECETANAKSILQRKYDELDTTCLKLFIGAAVGWTGFIATILIVLL